MSDFEALHKHSSIIMISKICYKMNMNNFIVVCKCEYKYSKLIVLNVTADRTFFNQKNDSSFEKLTTTSNISNSMVSLSIID